MILAKSNTKPKIGPLHHGRIMSLKAFEFAEVEEGYLSELARGYVVVSEVPNLPHALLTAFLRRHLDHYHVEHPDAIYLVLGTMECKLFVPDWESERHPDIAVYLSKPKERRTARCGGRGFPNWSSRSCRRVPAIALTTPKRDEYWTLGVKEYWIVDAKLKQVLVLRRGRSQWTEKTLTSADACETKLLPGFKLPCMAVFEVAGEE